MVISDIYYNLSKFDIPNLREHEDLLRVIGKYGKKNIQQKYIPTDKISKIDNRLRPLIDDYLYLSNLLSNAEKKETDKKETNKKETDKKATKYDEKLIKKEIERLRKKIEKYEEEEDDDDDDDDDD
jgi:predicted phosphohydrolase